MDSCLFCKIVGKKIPAVLVYEDECVVAFNDIAPQAPVHILIIPKKHISGVDAISELEEAIAGKLLVAASKIAQKIGLKDYRIVINNGVKAGQTVFHIHLHLLSGRDMKWPPG